MVAVEAALVATGADSAVAVAWDTVVVVVVVAVVGY